MNTNYKISGFISSAKNWGSLVRFSHTVFALPFAMSIAVYLGADRSISLRQILLILLCLVSARTAAMAFNRLLDREIDARNPRTVKREIPAGVLSVRSVVLLTIISIIVFIGGAAMLGELCLLLSPLVLVVLLGYSFTKRFTALSHLVLGLALALAPGGVWIALTNQFAWLPVWMMLGVLFWVAGFDILYSAQDFEFDREARLFSVPARLGIEPAFTLSRALHLAGVFALLIFGIKAAMGAYYYAGLALFSIFLIRQHRIISPGDLSRIDQAFFTQNGIASVVFFIGVMLDRLL